MLEDVDDTSPSAELRYFELLRQKSPRERLAIAARLTRAVRDLALAGMKQQCPDAAEQELRRGLAERLYGPEIAERLFSETAR